MLASYALWMSVFHYIKKLLAEGERGRGALWGEV